MSTVVKQMKIIHQDGFKEHELVEYRPIVFWSQHGKL